MKIKKEVIILEDINKVFKIINTVENYKNFVPYCNDSFITENSDGTIKGTLKFNLKGFDVTFTTNNSSKHNEHINMVLSEGPFKNLEGSFDFKQIKDSTNINFTLDYSVTNPLIDTILDKSMQKIANILIEALINECKR